MRKFIVLDTETTNSLDDPLTYDIGFAVIDEKGKVYESYSFVIAEIFLDKELMKSAYFANKIPQYWQDIKDGKRKLAKLLTVKKILTKVMKDNHINIVIAHNARFDYKSLATTQRFLTSSKYRYFLPYGTEVYCTLKMARQALKNNEEYDNFCYNNGYLTKRGCKRYTAEILYRFLTGQNDFVESHTGLEDVMIEKEIFVFCMENGVENGRLWK